MNGSDDDLSFAGEALDPFAPARVDDTIAAALLDRDGASNSSDGRLVQTLAAGHALPAGADAAIQRVRGRLAAAPFPPAPQAMDDEVPIPPVPARRAPSRPVSHAQNILRALAAGLVVALIAGGFVVALHSRQGNLNNPSGWVDVSITHAHTTQPLNFNLTNGISYAVAQTGGDIYACSGTALWYSSDGGATFAPFTPAPPPGTMDGTCTLGTVSGLPGVFVGDSATPPGRISYAEPGGAWRTLGLPDAVPANMPAPGGGQPVLPGQSYQNISRPIFFPGQLSEQEVQYAGQWLLLIVPGPLALPDQAGIPTSALIATPDFGKTWVWLDAALNSGYQQACASFVIPSVDPSMLDCVTAGPLEQTSTPGVQASTPGLAFSQDFGKTWQPASLSAEPLSIAGANDKSIFLVRQGNGGPNQLVRYDLATETAVTLATLPDWEQQGTTPFEPPIVLLADGTVYQAFARGTTGDITVGLDAVRPGASHVTQVVPTATLSAENLSPPLAFGGLDGTAPALYLGVGVRAVTGNSGVAPLYRRALPTPATPFPPTATVSLPTATVTATDTPQQQLPRACASDPVTTAAIRPGGQGALDSTFPARWGGSDGVAAGTTYFGRYHDTGQPIIGVPSTELGGRVLGLTYHVDSTAHITLAQAQTIAASILPADAHPFYNGAPPSKVSPITDTYCSAAVWAAFPPGSSNFTGGDLAVTYYLRTDGSVVSIDFSGAIIG